MVSWRGRVGGLRACPVGVAVLAIAVSVLAAACQPGGTQGPAVSIDEAKRITASIAETGVNPPPREASDILDLLKNSRDESERLLAPWRMKADSPPPAGASAITLARFFDEQAQAADLIGRAAQSVEAARKASENAARARGLTEQERVWIRWRYGDALFATGNALEARAVYQGILKDVPFSPNPTNELDGQVQGHSIAWYGQLAATSGMLGDLAAAAEAMRRVETLHRASVSWPIGGRERGIFDEEDASARATVAELMGSYAEAEAEHRKALQALAPASGWDLWPGVRREALQRLEQRHHAQLAVVLAHEGRLPEAENEVRIALKAALATHGRFSVHTISILQGMVDILVAQGRNDEAERLAAANIESLMALGVSPTALFFVKARVQRAEALAALSRWPEATREFDRLRDDLGGESELFQRLIVGHLARVQGLLTVGRTAEARQAARQAVARVEGLFGPGHYATAEARGFLAMAEAAAGEQRSALTIFESVIPVLLAQRGLEGGARTARLTALVEDYLSMLADIRGTPLEGESGIDAAGRSFELADVARGASVQRAVTLASARVSAGDPELADLVRLDQDAAKRIDSLFQILNGALNLPAERNDPAKVDDLRRRITELQGARRALFDKIESGFPAYTNFTNPKPVTVAAVRAALRPTEALLATYVAANRTYVWTLSADGGLRFAAVPLGRAALTERVGILRAALEPNAQVLGDIPEFDLAGAYDLYRALLAPVAAGWQDKHGLLVVGHGPLGYLPLAVLPTRATSLPPEGGVLFANYRDVPWLIRDHSVAHLPSAATLVTLRGLPPAGADRRPLVGFGDPYFSREQALAAAHERPATVALATRGVAVHLRAVPRTEGLASATLARLPRLPDTAEEILGIAGVLGADPSRDVFLGRRATEKAVRAVDLTRYRVVAFATHGLIAGDLDGLTQPALALSAPEVTGDDGDGLLTMGEIPGLRLNADWVVLSACNTGSGEGAGAEAVSGLGRAFFYAGARALLVSNWPVETTSAKALTTGLFRREAASPGVDRAEALRQAMLALINGPGRVDPGSGRVVFAYAHPLFWAPFSVIGDPGRDFSTSWRGPRVAARLGTAGLARMW